MPSEADQDPAIDRDEQHGELSPATASVKQRLIGQKLGGRYLIEREMERGGMGAVYLAHDKPELHSRLVVVKVLLEEGMRNEWILKKFQQEIESLTRLDDPGVVGIFDAGRLDEGTPYLVMQYVDGSNLRVLIKPEGMNLQQIANTIKQIGRSISAAHDAGILHRDLKPENIMLRKTATGEHVKIIDFGIAKVRNSVSGQSTATGVTAGTIGYMSPEQLSAQPLTAASDIYSLGVIAYEMVTGRKPFNPDSIYQLLEMQRAGVRVKPVDLRPSLPEEAQEIILKALAFDSKDRYQRAHDFGDQLARALSAGSDAGELTTRDLLEGKAKEASKNELLPPTVPAEAKVEPSPSRPKIDQPSLETAHVLFSDIVGYSKLMIDEQTERLQQLQDIVRRTPEFQRAQAAGQLLRLPTGDGMALSFFGDPESPVRCAVEVSRALREHPDIKLRMGVNSGLVYRIADINENLNISGGGINIAQRVMDCGDAGHILLSERVADDLGQLSRWKKDLHDLGEAIVKHGDRVHIYNLYNDEIGNPEVPAKLGASQQQPRSFKLVFAVAGLLLVLVAGLFWFRGFRRTNQPTKEDLVMVPNVAAERGFTYFLTPSDKSLSAEDERYAGNEPFRNGSKFTFVLIPEQAGALYLVDQGKGGGGGSALNVLFPTPKNNNGSSMVTANQRVEVPVHFDPYSGDEHLLIIWTTTPVTELDAIFKDAAGTDWEIKNATQIETVNRFLNKHQSPAPKAEIDPEKKQTTVRGQGEILISSRILKHRDF